MAIGRGESSVTLAGVTYQARRGYDGLSLDIDGTGIHKWIDTDRLRPADGGRGLGTVIINEHDRLPERINERQRIIEDTQRQLAAERSRPVAEHFPRQGELDNARARRDELTEELKPKQPAVAAHTGAPTVDDSQLHPVYGDRTPTTSERYEWTAGYSRYNPTAQPHWGNRAKGARAWVEAVNAPRPRPGPTAPVQDPSRRPIPRRHARPALRRRSDVPRTTATPRSLQHPRRRTWRAHRRRHQRLARTTAPTHDRRTRGHPRATALPPRSGRADDLGHSR